MADDVIFDVADEPLVPLSVTDPSSESADFAIGDAIIEAVSPTVDVTAITGGHRMTVHDINGEHSFDVMDGEDGATGPAGPGVPTGGSAGQVLRKASATDYDTEWHTPDATDLTGTLPVAHGGTGATTAAGALTALGAASAADLSALSDVVDAIGTFVSSSSGNVDIVSGTGTGITSVTIGAGTWVLMANVGFASNSNGNRMVNISTTSGDTAGSTLASDGVQVSAASSGYTYIHTGHITKRTAQTTYYLNVRHGAGTTLSVAGTLKAVRIK